MSEEKIVRCKNCGMEIEKYVAPENLILSFAWRHKGSKAQLCDRKVFYAAEPEEAI